MEEQEADGVRTSRGCLGAWLRGTGVRKRAQPLAALQQGSWGVAGLTVPQAVCLLRVRGRVWPVDSPHTPVSFITECNLGFPANVTRRESHRVRRGSRLISRSWGAVLAGTAHALRLDWRDACMSSRGVSALRTGSLVSTRGHPDRCPRCTVCVRSAAPGAACLACWRLESLRGCGLGRWPWVRSGPLVPSSTVSLWR